MLNSVNMYIIPYHFIPCRGTSCWNSASNLIWHFGQCPSSPNILFGAYPLPRWLAALSIAVLPLFVPVVNPPLLGGHFGHMSCTPPIGDDLAFGDAVHGVPCAEDFDVLSPSNLCIPISLYKVACAQWSGPFRFHTYSFP